MFRSQDRPRRRLNFALTPRSNFGSAQSAGLKKQLDTIVALTLKTTGDMANLQVYEAASQSLRIVSHFGFPQEFVDFFSSTHAGQAACGTAMKRRRRVVIEDVASHPVFKGTEARDVMMAAEARAVQSTPLISGGGELMGILSSHYRKQRRPSTSELRSVDVIARQAANLIERAYVAEALRATLATGAFTRELRETGIPSESFDIYQRGKHGFACWTETVLGWEEAIARLQYLSATEPGEFVLFRGLQVLAVGEDGALDVRESPATKAESDPFSDPFADPFQEEEY